jgi:hypothetical protein
MRTLAAVVLLSAPNDYDLYCKVILSQKIIQNRNVQKLVSRKKFLKTLEFFRIYLWIRRNKTT